MTYAVNWDADAEQELADLWVAAVDRSPVTAAAARIDQLLAQAPLRVGQARTSSVHRVVAIGGLAVEYEVVEDDKRILVHSVYATG